MPSPGSSVSGRVEVGREDDEEEEAHRATSRPGGGAGLLQLTGHVFQEAASDLSVAQSWHIIIALHRPEDTTKRLFYSLRL